MRRLPPASQDIALGDAFGDLAVPWHLTTREFVADLHRVLRPGGFYMMNLIDYPPHRFLRAEVATLSEFFDHVTSSPRRSSWPASTAATSSSPPPTRPSTPPG